MDAPPGDAGSSTWKNRLMTGSVTVSESIQTAAHLAFWVLSCAAGRCGSPSPSLHSVKTDVNSLSANSAPVAVAGADMSPCS